MTRLVFTATTDDRHDGDVEQIVRACAKFGYVISPSDARAAWQDYSDAMAAGWMTLPGWEEDIALIVRNRCTELTS